jgi:hypothetical protein
MSNQEADDCAALIVEIFGQMCKTHDYSAHTDNVVQMHAVERAADDFVVPALIANN